jgi:hypothetical protein
VSSQQIVDDAGGPAGLSSALRRNIEALRERRKQELRNAGREEKLADAIQKQNLQKHAFGGHFPRFLLHHLGLSDWPGWRCSADRAGLRANSLL